MSTHSTIAFYDENDKHLVTVYQQWDGYVEGVGHDLARFLRDIKIVNGIDSKTDKLYEYANGVDCMVAQFIAKHKTNVGNLYITFEDAVEEYHYIVKHIDNQFIISINDFTGTPEELLEETSDTINIGVEL